MLRVFNKFSKQETIFLVIAVLIILMLIGFISYSINFLVGNINKALNQNPTSANAPAQFNIEGLKKLGIMK